MEPKEKPMKENFGRCSTSLLIVGALISLLCGAFSPPSAVASTEPEEPKAVKLMFTAPKGDAQSRSYLALLIAAYSRRPGLVLLEGGETDRIEAEIALSEAGLVDPDSAIQDRRMTPTVKAEVRVVERIRETAEEPLVMILEAKITGPAGTTEFAAALEPSPGKIEAVFDEPIARTLPRHQRHVFLRGCLDEGWTMTDVEGDRCVGEIIRRCQGAYDGREIFGCIGRYGRQVRRQVLDADDAPTDLTAQELALMLRLKRAQGKMPELSEHEQALFVTSMERSQARRKARTAVLDGFREALVEAMNGLLTPRFQTLAFDDKAVESFKITGAGVKHFRWAANEAMPMAMVTFSFSASDREWSRDDSGTIRRFIDRLMSIGVRGMGPSEVVGEYRVLTGRETRERGSVDFAITSDHYGKISALVPHDPIYRTEPL